MITGPELSIVIPTWNGRHLLERYLPSVVAEAERWRERGGTADIIVSDDGSTDGTGAWLHDRFGSVAVVRSEVNRGFSPAVNAGIAAATAPLVLLLNNDLRVSPGLLDGLASWFADPLVFGVTLRGLDIVLRPGGDPELRFSTGGKVGRFRRGFWECWRNYDAESSVRGLPTFSLVGGFCAFRRQAFLELGGFDEILAPYYWEDIDLSYRARKRGWRLVYAPDAIVHHEVSATVARHSTRFRRRMVIHRNRLLFHWMNLDGRCLVSHLLWAHLLLAQMLLRGDLAYHAGYWAALRRSGAVRARRLRDRPLWRVGDRELRLEAPSEATFAER
jgi:GT2 family glycosyltransferase